MDERTGLAMTKMSSRRPTLRRLVPIIGLLLVWALIVPAGAAPRPVLIWTSEVHGGYDVVTLYSDGTISEPLNRLSTYGEYPTVSPDGKRVAFIGWTAVAGGAYWVPGGQIYVADLETGAQQLVYTPQGGEIYALEWGPRGDQLAFNFYPDQRADGSWPYTDIWSLTETGSGTWEAAPLIARRGDEAFASWSPDGEYIIYGYDPDKNGVSDPGDSNASTLAISRVDGTDHRNLIRRGSGGHLPVYSPDGKWIAYVDYAAGELGRTEDLSRTELDRIRIMRADGSAKRTLADGRKNPWALDFSSDGRFLTWGEGEGWDATRILQLDLTRPGRVSVLVDTPGIDVMPEYYP